MCTQHFLHNNLLMFTIGKMASNKGLTSHEPWMCGNQLMWSFHFYLAVCFEMFWAFFSCEICLTTKQYFLPHILQKGLVEKVVGRTFDSSVLESPQNVFLEVWGFLYTLPQTPCRAGALCTGTPFFSLSYSSKLSLLVSMYHNFVLLCINDLTLLYFIK